MCGQDKTNQNLKLDVGTGNKGGKGFLSPQHNDKKRKNYSTVQMTHFPVQPTREREFGQFKIKV